VLPHVDAAFSFGILAAMQKANVRNCRSGNVTPGWPVFAWISQR
jgi:hypothetical protein